MKTEDTIHFNISPTKKIYKDYWSRDKIEYASKYNESEKPYFRHGTLYINDFRFPEYTEVFYGFFDKMHLLASIVASEAAVDSSPTDSPGFITDHDLNIYKNWLDFKKVVAGIMKDHKLGQRISVGDYLNSWCGSHDGDFMIDRGSKPGSFCSMIERHEIIPTDNRNRLYFYFDNVYDRLFPTMSFLNTREVKNILEDDTSGILFRKED